MKWLIWIQTAWFLLGVGLLLNGQKQEALGWSIGVSILLSNLVLFAWVGSSQKLIALKTPIVVLKYAIWAGVIYYSLNHTTMDKLYFVMGLSVFVVSLILYSVLLGFLGRESKEN